MGNDDGGFYGDVAWVSGRVLIIVGPGDGGFADWPVVSTWNRRYPGLTISYLPQFYPYSLTILSPDYHNFHLHIITVSMCRAAAFCSILSRLIFLVPAF